MRICRNKNSYSYKFKFLPHLSVKLRHTNPKSFIYKFRCCLKCSHQSTQIQIQICPLKKSQHQQIIEHIKKLLST